MLRGLENAGKHTAGDFDFNEILEDAGKSFDNAADLIDFLLFGLRPPPPQVVDKFVPYV